MATIIEIENSIKVLEMLSQIEEIEVLQDEKRPDLFIITEPESGLILKIDVEETTIVFFMDIEKVEKITDELGELLLIINNKEAVHGAFGYNPDTKRIVFKNILEIENLDMNELKSSIITMIVTVFESISRINKIIGG